MCYRNHWAGTARERLYTDAYAILNAPIPVYWRTSSEWAKDCMISLARTTKALDLLVEEGLFESSRRGIKFWFRRKI